MTFIFIFRLMYNKTIIRLSFCDIQNNQGLCKGYQPQPSVSADNPYLNLHYSEYHKKLHPIIVYKCMLFAIWEVHIQGSYGSWKTWKVLEFYYDISRTGKSWKKATGPGKFWKSVKCN